MTPSERTPRRRDDSLSALLPEIARLATEDLELRPMLQRIADALESAGYRSPQDVAREADVDRFAIRTGLGTQKAHEVKNGVAEYLENEMESVKEAQRAAREAARDSMFAEILTVLTPEQRAIIEEIQNQLDQGIYPEILVEKRVEFFTELLSLTADQQNIFSAMFAQFGQDMLEARNNAANRRELHETLRALFEELDTQIAAVLNADQLEVYNTWKAERERHRPHHRPHGG